MKILSWNVLASEWIKKSYYPTVKENILFDRRSRLKRIMERIIYENPDIILLQEVMSLEYKTFMKYLLEYELKIFGNNSLTYDECVRLFFYT